MGFYIEHVTSPSQSAVVAEDIDVGEYAALNSSGNAERFEQQNHAVEDMLGVAKQPLSGQQIREDDDDTGGFTYLSSESDRASFNGREDDDIIKVKTIEDNTTDPAPSIDHGDVVGFVDTSAVAGSGGEYGGRIVEEGYADSTPTTFNRTNANFVALGVAYRPTHDHSTVTSYDEPVRVRVRKDVLD